MAVKRIPFDELLPDAPFVGEVNGMAECVNLLPLDSRWLPVQKTSLYASLTAAAFPGIGARVNGAAYCSTRESAIFGVWDNNLEGALYELTDSGGVGAIADVSKTSDSSYTRGVTDLRSWRFTEFDSYFIATGIATPVQKITPTASRFTDLITGATKPTGKHVCTAKTHLVLGWIRESAVDYPRRVWWSGQGDPESFEVGTARSGFVDIAGSYGEVTGLVGFEDGFLCFTHRKVILFQYVGGEEVWFSTEIGSGPDGMPEVALHSTARVAGGTIYRSHDGYKLIAGSTIAPVGEGKVRSYVREISTDPSPPHYASAVDEVSGLLVHYGGFGLELADPEFSFLVQNPAENRFSVLDDTAIGFTVDVSDPTNASTGVPVFPVFYPHSGGSTAGNDSISNLAFVYWNRTTEKFEVRVTKGATYAAARQKSRLLEPTPGSASLISRVRPVVELEAGTGKVVPKLTVEIRGWNDLWKKTAALTAIALDTDTQLNTEGWMESGLPASAQRWELLVSLAEFDSTAKYVPINLLGVDIDTDGYSER